MAKIGRLVNFKGLNMLDMIAYDVVHFVCQELRKPPKHISMNAY